MSATILRGNFRDVTFGSLFSGAGGFEVGFERAGMRCLWQCEKDRNCKKLIRSKWPNAHLYEDICAIDTSYLARVDVVCGGSPCQGFSIAGLRQSMSDDRSNLALQYLRIVNAIRPAVVVWENVPGVLSTDDNAFGCFLAGLVGTDAPLVPPAQCGGRWTNAGVAHGPERTAAWRVLDAQFFGVAQRRNRVFVVASNRAGLPFQVLFEPEGVCGNPPARGEAREGVAPPLAHALRAVAGSAPTLNAMAG